MKFLEQFYSSSRVSNMRINFSLIIYAVIVLYLAIAGYIIVFAIRQVEITHWSEMSIFLVGLTTAAWSMAYEKRKQKAIETNKDTDEDTNKDS